MIVLAMRIILKMLSKCGTLVKLEKIEKPQEIFGLALVPSDWLYRDCSRWSGATTTGFILLKWAKGSRNSPVFFYFS